VHAAGWILTAKLALFMAVGFVRFVGESARLTQQAALSTHGVTYRIEGVVTGRRKCQNSKSHISWLGKSQVADSKAVMGLIA
jgi:hypothetical protein